MWEEPVSAGAEVLTRVRALGGFEGLSDEALLALIEQAREAVGRDLTSLGVTGLDPSALNALVAVKACALAAKRVRPPLSESIGGVSASYSRLDWDAEYAKELNAAVLAAREGKAYRGWL